MLFHCPFWVISGLFLRLSEIFRSLLLDRLPGAVFLGLNGVVVKSHGSATANGVANAVAVAARLLEEDLTARIRQDLAELGEHLYFEVAARG